LRCEQAACGVHNSASKPCYNACSTFAASAYSCKCVPWAMTAALAMRWALVQAADDGCCKQQQAACFPARAATRYSCKCLL
jgi:hypothetical protein